MNEWWLFFACGALAGSSIVSCWIAGRNRANIKALKKEYDAIEFLIKNHLKHVDGFISMMRTVQLTDDQKATIQQNWEENYVRD